MNDMQNETLLEQEKFDYEVNQIGQPNQPEFSQTKTSIKIQNYEKL